TPPIGMAAKMPFQPKGLKPPPAVKLPGWKATTSSTTTVMAGMAIFHHTATLLVSESHFTPITLMKEKRSISAAATTEPGGAAPPRSQEIMDAGPAIKEALSAPNSQPEPMIEPTEAKRRPTSPTSRRSLRASAGAAPMVGEAVVIPSPFRAGGIRQVPRQTCE